MRVFDYNDYKSYLIDLVDKNKDIKGFQGKLAEAANCQSSYLSKALSSHIHLTLDHIAGISEYLRLKEDEAEYFFELLLFEKASHPNLKRRCKTRLSQLKNGSGRIDRFVTGEPANFEKISADYYSSHLYQAVHLATSISNLQSAKAIARKLSLNLVLVERILKALHEMELVTFKNGEWKMTKMSIHLPVDSPLTSMNHLNWRNLAGLDIQKFNTSSLHYSAIHSISIKDFELIKGKILSLIKESQNLVSNSNAEELICVCFDCFEV